MRSYQKAQAYDVCFNHPVLDGNLIYNPNFRNTAKEFLKDASNIPENPDGYIGDCYVISKNGENKLCTNGNVSYFHYGIPLGKIKYSAYAKGSGNISFYIIKNNTPIDKTESNLNYLGKINVQSLALENYSFELYIPNNPETKYEQICGGLGNKIMGIKIVYSNHLEIKNIDLRIIR